MKNNVTKHNPLSTKGFTLVELMVSLTVFSIVMTISTGTLLVMIDINAKAQAINSATSNLTFALDSMTRDLRTGRHYYCDVSPSFSFPVMDSTKDDTGCDYVSFTREKDNFQIAYRLSGGQIERNERDEDGSNVTGWIPLTSDSVVIDIMELDVSGSSPVLVSGPLPSDNIQPSIDIFVKGHVNNGLDTDTDFAIQSHIVQRKLDIK